MIQRFNYLASYNSRADASPLVVGAVAILVLVLLPLLPLFWIVDHVRRQYSLRVLGFCVTPKGRANVEYERRHEGKVFRLTIYGEHMAIGPQVIYVPNEADWDQKMPAWASGRRNEVLDNVKRVLGTKHYEYVSS